MATATDLELSISANVAGLKVGLEQAQASVRGAAQTMRTELGSGYRGASEASASFENRVRALKGEMASGDRTINFFARSLNGIVPEASAAGQGIRLLADGLIGGIGLGFALQGIMAILTLFGDSLKESSEKEREAAEKSKQYAAERLKAYQDADREFRKLQFIRGGGTAEGFASSEKDSLAQLRVMGAEDALGQAREAFRARWADTVPEEGTMQAKEYADELERIRGLEAELAAAQRAAGKTVATGVAGMEGAVKTATETVKAHGDAAERATEQVQGLTAAAEGLAATVGFAGNGSDKWMPAGTGMLTAGAGGNQFLASFSKGFDEKAKRESEAEKAAQEKAAAAQAMAADIANSWVAALDQMLGATKVSAQSIVKVFAQLAAQMVQQAGFAWAGPIGGLIGLAANFLPSAAGGWRVPQDTIAQVHAGEHVIPREIAQRYEAGAPGGTAQAPMPVTIVAMDGPSLKDFLIRNGTDFNSAVRELARQGR